MTRAGLLLAIALLASCRERSPGPAPVPSTPDASSPADAPPAAKPQADDGAALSPELPRAVKLLTAGAEPRRELRLHPAVGEHFGLLVTTRHSGAQVSGEDLENEGSKPLSIVHAAMVREVADGGIKLEVAPVMIRPDQELPQQRVDAIRGKVEPLANAKLELTVSRQGLTTRAEGHQAGPSALSEEEEVLAIDFLDSFALLVLPLPAEAVGIGATWQTETSVEHGGQEVRETRQYELTGLKGDQVTVAIKITQTAPAMPSFAGSGDGTWTFDLGTASTLVRDVRLTTRIEDKSPVGQSAVVSSEEHAEKTELHLEERQP